MLWYKAWLDTRWRFLIGLALIVCTALANALTYPTAQRIISEAARNGSINELLAGGISWQLTSNFRGYVWAQVVHQNLYYLWTFFAVLLAADGPPSQRRGAIFTLSLPVSRRRLCAVRAATDLGELALLSLLPLLAVSLAAPAIDHSYPVADALVHGIHMWIGGTFFYCLTLLLAAFFEDRWRPILITLAMVVGVGVGADFVPLLAAVGPASVMTGESYFRSATPAWMGLFIWLTAAALLFHLAVRSIEKRDF
jgi:ABC-2 type transport system permease protein